MVGVLGVTVSQREPDGEGFGKAIRIEAPDGNNRIVGGEIFGGVPAADGECDLRVDPDFLADCAGTSLSGRFA